MLKAIKIWQSLKKYNCRISVMVVVLWLAMLVVGNYANSQTLQRNQLNETKKQTEDRLRLMNTTVSDLQAIQRLANESKRLNLVRIDNQDIYYLNTQQQQMALAK